MGTVSFGTTQDIRKSATLHRRENDVFGTLESVNQQTSESINSRTSKSLHERTPESQTRRHIDDDLDIEFRGDCGDDSDDNKVGIDIADGSSSASNDGSQEDPYITPEDRQKINALIRKPGAVYCNAVALLNESIKCVRKAEDYNFLMAKLHKVGKQMLKRRCAQGDQSQSGTNGMIRPPNLSSHRKSSKRIPKVTSPVKKTKRQRNNSI